MATETECDRKGHVYWSYGDGREGNKCLDCGYKREVSDD